MSDIDCEVFNSSRTGEVDRIVWFTWAEKGVIYLVRAVFPFHHSLLSYGSASGAGGLRAFRHITLCISIDGGALPNLELLNGAIKGC